MKQTFPFACFLLSAVVTLSSATRAGATDPQAAAPAPKSAAAVPVQASPADIVRAQLPSYPLKTCVIAGDEVLGKSGPIVDHVVQGRLVRLCCKDCVKEVDKDPAPVIKKIDAAVVAAQKPMYPLAMCPVTGEKLGDKAVDFVYGTRLVRLANADAVAMFGKDPAAAMAKVDQAWIAALGAKYTLKTCVVTGEAFGGDMGDPFDYLYGTTLVRLCCKGCVRKFEKEPEKYTKLLK